MEYQRSLERKVAERTEELIRAYRKLKQTNLETVRVLAETIEAKDPYTRGHCNRVRLLSSELADRRGYPEEDIEVLEYAALLHDIGKLGISEALLHKIEPLSEEERHRIHLHPIIGEKILKTVDFFRPCLPIVRHHHERYDGSGYPDGLQGEEINIFARIVSVADAFDAMISNRPYRKALSLDAALAQLKGGRGSQFDPSLVDLFIGEELFALGTARRDNPAGEHIH